MKHIFYIISIVFFLFGSKSYSQNLKELKIETEEVVNDSINPLAPAKAAFYSAILPGLGQVYNKRYWKVPIVLGAIGASTYFIVSNNNNYNKFRNEYKKRLLGTNDPNDPYFNRLTTESIVRGQKFYQRNRDLAIIITGGLYVLNIIDANVDAHLLQFNVNDNLSLRPNYQYSPFDNKPELGMQLTFNF